MRKSFELTLKVFCLGLFLAIAPIAAWAQSYTYQPPVHPYTSFSPTRPMASWECSKSQLANGVPMIEYLDTDGVSVHGGVDCHGVVITGGEPLTLSSAMLLEFNNANTLTGVTAHSLGFTTYTGTIPNCATPNALKSEWVLIAGFSNAGNNGRFGPVTACTATTLVVANAASVIESASATATNIGFEVRSGFAGYLMAPRTIAANYVPGTTGYTLGNSDNVFSFTYPANAPTVEWTLAHAFTLNSFITTTGSDLQYVVGVSNLAGPINAIGDSLIVQLTGTTPALTAGNGSVALEVDYNAF